MISSNENEKVCKIKFANFRLIAKLDKFSCDCLLLNEGGPVTVTPISSVADPDPSDPYRMFLGLLDPDPDPLVRGTLWIQLKQK